MLSCKRLPESLNGPDCVRWTRPIVGKVFLKRFQRDREFRDAEISSDIFTCYEEPSLQEELPSDSVRTKRRIKINPSNHPSLPPSFISPSLPPSFPTSSLLPSLPPSFLPSFHPSLQPSYPVQANQGILRSFTLHFIFPIFYLILFHNRFPGRSLLG